MSDCKIFFIYKHSKVESHCTHFSLYARTLFLNITNVYMFYLSISTYRCYESKRKFAQYAISINKKTATLFL